MPSTKITDLWVGPTPPPEIGPGTAWFDTSSGKPVLRANSEDRATWETGGDS